MDYRFTEDDLNYLGVTEPVHRAFLLKTTIVGNYYCDKGLYANKSLSCMQKLGGIDISVNSSIHRIWIGKRYDYSDLSISVYSEEFDVISYIENGLVVTNCYGDDETNSTMVTYQMYDCKIDEILSVQVLGKTEICGIIWDGDATLSYGNKSITIQVYDDTGVNLFGYKGIKHINYNYEDVNFLTLNDVTYDLRDYLEGNLGYKLPKLLPLQHTTYDNDYYAVYVCLNVWIKLLILNAPARIENDVLIIEDNIILSADVDEEYNCLINVTTEGIPNVDLLDDNYIIASDHDIYDNYDYLCFEKNIDSYINRE